MRDFILVTAICIALAFALDYFWAGGKMFGYSKEAHPISAIFGR
jgi:hypothetical protein